MTNATKEDLMELYEARGDEAAFREALPLFEAAVAALRTQKTSGPLYMSAFLLEREGRIPEAIEAWQSILDWSQARGNKLDMEWPTRELDRLRKEP